MTMRSEPSHPASRDTEITLGAGKMLALFFGLVLLCAVFFGMGFSMGRNSLAASPGDSALTPAVAAPRPAATKSTSSSLPAASSEKPEQSNSSAAVDHSESDAKTADGAASETSGPPDPNSVAPGTGYYVQVAAVSKQEDAGSLIEALKKKQYPAFSASSTSDKLFHVQVGPFSDIKQAEAVRANLFHDGYNPILKK
jgi:cell division septation protein DedD